MDRNKAIEVVKSHYPANKQILNEALETLIPELKESEDEKIRKQILSFLKEIECDHYRNIDFSSWIAWLERKGEQDKQHLYDVIVALWDLLDKIDTFSDLKITDMDSDNPFRKLVHIAQERHKLVKSDGYDLFIDDVKITNHKSREKQCECVIDCPQNHQDSNRPSGGIVLEDFNGGEGFYKLNLAYLNKKQVEEVEEMVREWNNEPSTSEEDIKDCIGLCLTDADEQRFKNYHTNLRDCLAWLEKQGEKCAIVWHSISEEPDEQEELLCEWESEDATWHDIAFYHADTKTFWDGEIQVENVTRWCYINDLLKNQGKQKTTDVELRFKVGDWVVNKYGYVWHVDSFDKKNYQVSNNKDLEDCYFKISDQDQFHLWTIADAKDGDVLCAYECDEPKIVFILKGTYKGYAIKYHCFYNIKYPKFDDASEPGNLGLYDEEKKDFRPATKEQRNLLFQKMKEAGYEWDYIDKKVLKID